MDIEEVSWECIDLIHLA